MKDENRTGWYALYLSITQNVSPAHAMAAMEGKRRNISPLTWEEFVRIYRNNEERLRLARRVRNSSEKTRAYQREYRRNHPMNEEQKKKRAAYLRRYRECEKEENIHGFRFPVGNGFAPTRYSDPLFILSRTPSPLPKRNSADQNGAAEGEGDFFEGRSICP